MKSYINYYIGAQFMKTQSFNLFKVLKMKNIYITLQLESIFNS